MKALSDLTMVLRTWFTQLFTYATVVVPDMQDNPSRDLDVVALPLPPVNNYPFLRMPELPLMLQTLRRYPGRLSTQLVVASNPDAPVLPTSVQRLSSVYLLDDAQSKPSEIQHDIRRSMTHLDDSLPLVFQCLHKHRKCR